MTDLPVQSTTFEKPQKQAAKVLTPHRRKAVRRWWRRKPINTLMVLLHRWPGIILGLLLVIECTSGAWLLYRAEFFRATHGEFYQHTASANPLSVPQAMAAVKQADPAFVPAWMSRDHGVYVFGDAAYQYGHAVDPGSGAVSGRTHLGGDAFTRLMENIHDCAFSCEGDPGYMGWTTKEVWKGGPSFLTGITWGSMILGLLGCLMILLFVTGIKIWWPKLRLLGRRFYKVRTGRGSGGRFARDYDLHNVIAAWAMPFFLLWGITGAALEFPGIREGWLAVTGGDGDRPGENAYTFTSNNPKGPQQVSFEQATSVALRKVPGQVRYVEFASKDVPYYGISIKTGYAPYGHRLFYSGDTYVYVDANDPTHTKITGGRSEPDANSFYDYTIEATHFGWNVNGWWRIIWLVFGLAPLALFVTGISTWLFRRGVKKRRKAALAAHDPAITPVESVDEELKAGHLADVDPELVHEHGKQPS